MRRLTAASARQVEGSGRFCSDWVWRDQGRPELVCRARPCLSLRPFPLQSRGVERRTSQPPLAWETSQSWWSKNWQGGREAGREGRGASGEMATLTKYFWNRFLQFPSHFTRNEIIWLQFGRKPILTGLSSEIWVTHPQCQCFFGWQGRKLKSSSQDLEIYLLFPVAAHSHSLPEWES